jgi:two-component system chemotaxis sensor kinase CheA
VDDLILEFLTETNENLSDLDTSLVELEQNPNNKDLLSQIFRVMHTIKGTSGFFDLKRLGLVAHHAEDLLGLFREGKLQATPEYISLIFESLDQIKIIIAGIGDTKKEPEGDDSALIDRLVTACAGEIAEPTNVSEIDPFDVDLEELKATPEGVKSQSNALTENDQVNTASTEASVAPQSLRVNVDVLEYLMTLVSELVLTRNQIMQASRSQKENDISVSLQRLNHIVSDLQEGVMKTRMQPVGNAWAKLPRIIRDISNNLGKKIELEMQGQDTELDRQVLEMIKDPLTHMVRNSGDHGIEIPEERLAAGKSETGRIKLNSYHQGGYILIEISDDGRGLSLEKIKNKILENNLTTETKLADMGESQIQQYIFAAGFSTAEKVTAVSGRGVGMDVVRSNIEKIGGSIEMESIEGKGTTFTIKIPLTLAIVSSLIIGVENERFALPQIDVTELLRVTDNGANQIEMVNETPVLRLREQILPLICLRKILGFDKREDNEPRYIAVINVGSYSFGIIVDLVFDTEEIVVKPISRLLNGQAVFSGNTILGDGQVIMILDSSGILKTSGIADKIISRDLNCAEEDMAEKLSRNEKSLLLFLAGDANLKAVPLEHVARLEEVNLVDIEIASGQRVIQYGDTLMPIYLYDQTRELPSTGNYPVIVFKTAEGMSGLLVDKILDITSHHGDYQIKSEGALEGSVIIQGKATDIINLSYDRSDQDTASKNGGESVSKTEQVTARPSPLTDLDIQTNYGASE